MEFRVELRWIPPAAKVERIRPRGTSLKVCDLMTISVLGPLRVTVAGRPVALPAKQRTLLAILAFQANRAVPQDRLIEASWGEDASAGHREDAPVARVPAPASARAGAATSVRASRGSSRTAAATGCRPTRRRSTPRCSWRLLETARAAGTEARTTVAQLQRAVALWRGPGVADVGDEPAAMAEIQQLEWLRLAAVEDLARLRLALGEHEQLVPELRRAVAEAPYNEQLWASLMIALGRCGKRAEALIAFQHARDALRAELDIEPGRELREHRAADCAPARTLDPRPRPRPSRSSPADAPDRGRDARNRNHRRVRTLVRDARH